MNSRDSRKSKDVKKDRHHYFEKTSRGESHVSNYICLKMKHLV